MALTIAEITKLAPAAAARTAAPHCSALYRFIPTMDVIEALTEEGYVPVAAAQSLVTDTRFNAERHARHMIRMRAAGAQAFDKKQMARLGGLVPEIVFYNSSNGTSGFELHRGIYRQVCSNGLIVLETQQAIATRHRNFEDARAVIDRVRALSASSKPLFDRIAAWSKLQLDATAQKRFAAEALVLRLNGNKERAQRYDPLTLLTPRREDDAAPTLWNLYNRAQENGQRYGAEAIEVPGQSRAGLHLRPIASVEADRAWNTELWALTERWAAKAGV